MLAVDAVDEKRKGPTYDKNDKTSLKATTKKNKIGTDESISNNLKCLNSTSNSAPSSAKPADSRRIMSVDVTEFDSVPQYMRGRLTLERVNSAVEAINRVIDEKYSLLRMNPSKLSVEMRQRFFVS